MKIKGSYVLALAIMIALGAWLATGKIVIGGQPDAATLQAQAAKTVTEKQPFSVRVRTFTTEQRIANLAVRGRTVAKARVQAKAETKGLVSELPRRKGSLVKAGETVCRIETGTREATLLKARAALAQTELDHEAATKLSRSGFAAETRVRALKAALDAARAALAEAEVDLARTTIKAPFDGVVEEENAELGDYLNVGAACLTIATRDPILAVGQVSERDIAALRPGMPGSVTLITGESVDGTISFIASSADTATRTFRVELEVPNPDGALRDGVTAQITLPLAPVPAHHIAASYLTLDDEGHVGVRAVRPDGTVVFHEVTILSDGTDGIWVAGLPGTVTIITVGQDYVKEGEHVIAVPEDKDKIG